MEGVEDAAVGNHLSQTSQAGQNDRLRNIGVAVECGGGTGVYFDSGGLKLLKFGMGGAGDGIMQQVGVDRGA